MLLLLLIISASCSEEKIDSFNLNDTEKSFEDNDYSMNNSKLLPDESLEKVYSVLNKNGLIINNEPISENITKYSINDFSNYIGTDLTKSSAKIWNLISISEINKEFPIEFVRDINENGNIYICYPILEGGNLLVLPVLAVDQESGDCDLECFDFLYMHELPETVSFDDIDMLESYDEIIEKYPCTLLETVRSSGDASYSFLKNGDVLAVFFSHDDSIEEKRLIKRTEMENDDDINKEIIDKNEKEKMI